MIHILPTLVNSIQSQSRDYPILHPQHSFWSHTSAKSLAYNINPSAHSQQIEQESHTKALTSEVERGQMCSTPCGGKCTQSSVSHIQPCINNARSGITTEQKHLLRKSIRLHTLDRARMPNNRLPQRVKECSCTPHPANASALSPASVTPSCKPVSTTSGWES